MAKKSKEEIEELLDGEEVELDDETSEENDATEDELEEEDASGVTPEMTRSNILSIATKAMAGMSTSDLIKFFNDSIASIGKESDAIPDGTSEKNKASIAMKGAIKEDLEQVFGANKNLSEEFKEKVTTLFEAAVGSRVSLIEAELQDAYEAALQEHTEKVTEELINSVDEYLNYVVSEWVEENQVAIESTLVNELNTSFILGLKDLFKEHFVDLPEDRIDVVDVLTARVEELEEQLNNSVSDTIELKKIVNDKEKGELIQSVCENLSVSQVEKFKTLVEDFNYDGDASKFIEKLNVVKEHHFTGPKKVTKTSHLIQEESIDDGQDTKPVNPAVARYFHAIR